MAPDLAKVMREHGGIYFVTSNAFGMSHMDGARAALKGGVRIIQYREKEAGIRKMMDEAQGIKQLCAEHGAIFLIDNRIDVALAVDSDGVHIGQEDAELMLARKLLPGKIIGVSAGNAKQAAQAEKGGATYLGVGAVFPTATKANAEVIGMKGFDEVRRSTRLPIYGIGGLKLEHVDEIRRHGGDGIAVISAIVGASDPVKAARELVHEWNRANKKH